ncbi:diguanylate cyclase [Halomonas mongoliensis]|uniref:diguanylate cyclase n=1 Tax=Halomonas mongoliensis TaxID=321265 RepID=UPI00403AA9FC
MNNSQLLHADRSAAVLEAVLELTEAGLWELEIDSGGPSMRMIGVVRDVTRYHEQESRWQRLARSVPGIIYTFRVDAQGRASFPYTSDRVRDFYGVTPEEVSRDPSCIFDAIHRDDFSRLMESIEASRRHLTDWQFEYRARAGGTWRWMEARSSPEREPDGGTVWQGLIYPVDERKALEDKLRRLSLTDELTGLYNRRHLLACMDEEIARFRRYGTPFAVVMLDLDHFKQVNDIWGHAVGDEVLKGLARLFRERLRETDIAGRAGGEEFLLLLPNTDEAGAVAMAEGVRQGLAATSFSDGKGGGFQVTVSGGVAAMRDPAEEHNHLWSRADRALYRAKEAGRNRVRCR